jgi:acetyl-CoA carboxylase alpha subunit
MLRKSIIGALDELEKMPGSKLLEARYDKFRKVGVFAE